MPLKIELMLALWVIVALISIFVGAMNIKYPDAAWERTAENLKRRGKTARWDRSRLFNAGLGILVGAALLGLTGWVGLQQLTADHTAALNYLDPATNKYTGRDLTPEESAELQRDPQAFMQKIAHQGGK